MMISTKAAIHSLSPSVAIAVIINPLDAKSCKGKQKICLFSWSFGSQKAKRFSSVLFFSVPQSGGPAMSFFNLLQFLFMYLLHCHNICKLLRKCGKRKYNETDFQYSLPFIAVMIGVTRDVI